MRSLLVLALAGLALCHVPIASAQEQSIRVKLGYHSFETSPIPNPFQVDFFSVEPPFPIFTQDPASQFQGALLPGAKVFKKSDFKGLGGEIEYDRRLNPAFSLGFQFGIYNLNAPAASFGSSTETFPRTFETNVFTDFCPSSDPACAGIIDIRGEITRADSMFTRSISADARVRVTYFSVSPKAHLVEILRGTKKGAKLSKVDLYLGPVVGIYHGTANVEGNIRIRDEFTALTAVFEFCQPCDPFIDSRETISAFISSGTSMFPETRLRIDDDGTRMGMGAVLGLEFRISNRFSVFVEDRYVHVRSRLFREAEGSRVVSGNFTSAANFAGLTTTTETDTSGNISTSTSSVGGFFPQQIPFNKADSVKFGGKALADWGGNTLQAGIAFRW